MLLKNVGIVKAASRFESGGGEKGQGYLRRSSQNRGSCCKMHTLSAVEMLHKVCIAR